MTNAIRSFCHLISCCTIWKVLLTFSREFPPAKITTLTFTLWRKFNPKLTSKYTEITDCVILLIAGLSSAQFDTYYCTFINRLDCNSRAKNEVCGTDKRTYRNQYVLFAYSDINVISYSSFQQAVEAFVCFQGYLDTHTTDIVKK